MSIAFITFGPILGGPVGITVTGVGVVVAVASQVIAGRDLHQSQQEMERAASTVVDIDLHDLLDRFCGELAPDRPEELSEWAVSVVVVERRLPRVLRAYSGDPDAAQRLAAIPEVRAAAYLDAWAKQYADRVVASDSSVEYMIARRINTDDEVRPVCLISCERLAGQRAFDDKAAIAAFDRALLADETLRLYQRVRLVCSEVVGASVRSPG